MSLSRLDRVRVALSPLYLVVGAVVLVRGWGVGPAMLVGAAFEAYGVYRLVLVRRALRGGA